MGGSPSKGWSGRRRASTRWDGSRATRRCSRASARCCWQARLRALRSRAALWSRPTPSPSPSLRPPRRLSQSVPLSDWYAHQRAAQGREAWATFGNWIDRHNPRFAFEISDNFIRGMRVDDATLAAEIVGNLEREARVVPVDPVAEGGPRLAALRGALMRVPVGERHRLRQRAL